METPESRRPSTFSPDSGAEQRQSQRLSEPADVIDSAGFACYNQIYQSERRHADAPNSESDSVGAGVLRHDPRPGAQTGCRPAAERGIYDDCRGRRTDHLRHRVRRGAGRQPGPDRDPYADDRHSHVHRRQRPGYHQKHNTGIDPGRSDCLLGSAPDGLLFHGQRRHVHHRRGTAAVSALCAGPPRGPYADLRHQ